MLLQRLDERCRRNSRLAASLLFLISSVVFLAAVQGQFVSTDIPYVLQDPIIANPHLGPRLFVTSHPRSFPALGEDDNSYYPLRSLMYWLLYRLAGPNPLVFHLTSLLLYAATVGMVFRVGRELLQNHLAAFTGALLWALHPQHVESVAWVSALPGVGATFVWLFAFYLFLRAEEKAGDRTIASHSLAALAYFPALFLGPVGITLPLLPPVYWLTFSSKGRWTDRVIRWTPYLLATAVYISIRAAVLGRFSEARMFRGVSLHIVASGVGLLGQHAKIFFWPTDLNPFRVFELGPSLHSPWPWVTLLALLAAWRWRRRDPAQSFLVFWWIVTLLPFLDIRQSGFEVADRFSLLPSVGPCLLVALVALVWLPRRVPPLQNDPVMVPVLGAVAFLWTLQDFRLITNWHDDTTLLAYSSLKSRASPTLHLVRGAFLQSTGTSLDRATEEYETALRLNETSVWPLVGVTYDCYLNLGQIALMKGKPEAGMRYFDKALRVAPSQSPAYRAMGTAYFGQRNYARAAEYLIQAVRISPLDVEARFFLGTCWINLGAPVRAAEQFQAARQIDPTYDQAYEAEARALEAAGDGRGAARVRHLKQMSTGTN